MGRLALYPEQRAIVSPAQFMTQCVANWKGFVKQSHISEVRDVEPVGFAPERRRIYRLALARCKERHEATSFSNPAPYPKVSG
jgi:hypothetical protein